MTVVVAFLFYAILQRGSSVTVATMWKGPSKRRAKNNNILLTWVRKVAVFQENAEKPVETKRKKSFMLKEEKSTLQRRTSFEREGERERERERAWQDLIFQTLRMWLVLVPANQESLTWFMAFYMYDLLLASPLAEISICGFGPTKVCFSPVQSLILICVRMY